MSEPRNPALQKLFGFLQLGEREGSGGPKVRHVWEQQHWRLPHLDQDTETHLLLRQESLLPEPVVQALVSRLRDGFTNQDELGRSILVTAEAEGSVTHARARELRDRHSRLVSCGNHRSAASPLEAIDGSEPMSKWPLRTVLTVVDCDGLRRVFDLLAGAAR